MGAGEKTKAARPRTPKNRYCAGAKLSEHKFLRILRGFSEGLTIAELKPTTHISGKTIRATYRLLRERLAEAITSDLEKFGGAGWVLANDKDLLPDAVSRSPLYKRHRKRHAPRIKGDEAERLLANELLVRVLCAVDLRGLAVSKAEDRARLREVLIIGLAALRHRDPVQKLAEFIPNARPHAHASLRLYEDYRRYLLKNPLGAR